MRSCFYTFTLRASEDMYGGLGAGWKGARWGEVGGRAAKLIRTSLDHSIYSISSEEFILDF